MSVLRGIIHLSIAGNVCSAFEAKNPVKESLEKRSEQTVMNTGDSETLTTHMPVLLPLEIGLVRERAGYRLGKLPCLLTPTSGGHRLDVESGETSLCLSFFAAER